MFSKENLSNRKSGFMILLAIIIISSLVFNVYSNLNSSSETEAPEGAVWIVDSDLKWSNGSVKYWLEESEKVTSDPDRSQGDWWIESQSMHWVDGNGVERKYKGPVVDSYPDTFEGDVWIENGFLHYVDAEGAERVTCWDDDEDGFFAESCGGEDCNDSDPNIKPGVTDSCNGIDDDCDGNIDEDASCGEGEECKGEKGCVCMDSDNDGHNDSACGGSDCNDDDETVWKSMKCYPDSDNDGFYSETGSTLCTDGSCPSGYSSEKGDDCCDQDNRSHPGADYYDHQNECGSWDWNCSGNVEKKYTEIFDDSSICGIDDDCQEGWFDSVRECGESGDYCTEPECHPAEGCDCKNKDIEYYTQICR